MIEHEQEARLSKPAAPPRKRYRIRSLGYSSARFGPCGVCGGLVADVHIQTPEEWIDADEFGPGDWVPRRAAFGHRECLIEQRAAEVSANG